jgi:hypothetical protein
MPSIPHPNQIESSRKHARFKHAQKESRHQQTRIVLHKTLQHRHQPKTKHTDAKPDTGFHLLEQNIRRDFAENVGDEEDN